MSTKMDRKIASRETIMVNKAKGKGRNAGTLGILPTFTIAQKVNQTAWMIRNLPVLAKFVIESLM
jgi:hypothetical protein